VSVGLSAPNLLPAASESGEILGNNPQTILVWQAIAELAAALSVFDPMLFDRRPAIRQVWQTLDRLVEELEL
jgi:hypothetical protein